MDQRSEFTEEMFEQMYRRRGSQVLQLCRQAAEDRDTAVKLTFDAFTAAYRHLSSTEQPLTVEYQDNVLLDATRRIIDRFLPEQQEEPAEKVSAAQPDEEEAASVLHLPEELEDAGEELPVLTVEDVAPENAVPGREEIARSFGEEAELELPEEPRKSGRNVGWTILVVVLAVLILGLLWAIWGVAQNLFPLPRLDLGYEWFNANVYPLF